MQIHRATITTHTLLVVFLSSLLCASSALAGSVLSGYGGPGQGNQAILGSALIGGPSSGGGGGSAGGPSGGGGGGEPTSSSSGSLSRATVTRPGAGGGGAKGSAGSGPGGAGGVRAAGGAGASSTGAVAASAAVSSPALGLSGVELLYILIALGALLATAVATRQMARSPESEGPRLKGLGAEPE